MKTLTIALLVLLPFAARSQTTKDLFQQGLFEEETNHDIQKAADDYAAAVAAFDAQRQFAAMALVHLAAAKEKQGHKDEAVALRDRLSRDFPEQTSGESKEAQHQTEEWLAIIDAGKYAESWDKAADYFKKALTQKAWEQACNAVRKPLGAVKSRVFKSATHKVPGAPAGNFLMLQFTTSFENLDNAVETVTPMLEKDGKWRSTGYFIRPGDASYSPP